MIAAILFTIYCAVAMFIMIGTPAIVRDTMNPNAPAMAYAIIGTVAILMWPLTLPVGVAMLVGQKKGGTDA